MKTSNLKIFYLYKSVLSYVCEIWFLRFRGRVFGVFERIFEPKREEVAGSKGNFNVGSSSSILGP
jgi:hypothetical protein